MNPVVKKISLMGIFTALGVASGYAFIYIPNVELVTATVFISGFLLGIKEGLTIGILTEAIYSLFNPYGMAAPPLFVAQILSMGFAGILGGVMGKQKNRMGKIFVIRLGLAGLVSTLIFAILTTASFIFFTALSPNKLLYSFITGLGFYVTHILSNILIFLTLVPSLLNTAEKIGWSFHPTKMEKPHEVNGT